jgi:molecular chaperone DnaJ
MDKSSNLASLPSTAPDHYATLGLDRDCSDAHIRAAYRLLAKHHHPDVNGGSPTAVQQTQALNAAYEVLSDPKRRSEYDGELAAKKTPVIPSGKTVLTIEKEVFLRFEEFIRGTRLDIRVDDLANPGGAETYELVIPPETAPGARFRVPRAAGGFVLVRAKARPDSRFKARGPDLRCDLKISFHRATQGGTETLRDATARVIRIEIPKNASRGEIIRIPGEGLPKPRGGRGDLLVRVLYTPNVQIRRTFRR